jgi:hypothetical protein
MIWEWIEAKSSSLMAFVVGIGFIGVSFLHSQYRYFHLCIALIAFIYGYRQLRRHDTPFQKHERELRRKSL